MAELSQDELDCLIPLFYIKPQLALGYDVDYVNCLIPLFYIKPQLALGYDVDYVIALYLFSTSNHNEGIR